MKNNQNAKKEIQRDQYFKIRMSKEEKDLWYKYAKSLEINPSRLARNILMIEAEKNALAKGVEKTAINALKKYYEITKQFDMLERMKED